MEVQLESLVRSIKSDGVESAKKEAANIIAQAKEEAQRIVANAQEEAGNTQKRAKAGSRKAKANRSKMPCDRLPEIWFWQSAKIWKELFRKLLQQDVAAVLSGESLERIILALMKGWSLNSNVDIQLSAAGCRCSFRKPDQEAER